MTSEFGTAKVDQWQQFEKFPDPPTDEMCVMALRSVPKGRDALILGCSKLVRAVIMADYRRFEDDPLLHELTSAGYEAVVAAVDSYEAGHGMQLSSWVWRKIGHALARVASRERRYRQHHVTDMPEIEADDEESEDYHADVTADTGWYGEPVGMNERAMQWTAEYQGIRERLKPAEKQLLDYMRDERSSVEIAALLGVSQSTAFRRIENLMNKISS